MSGAGNTVAADNVEESYPLSPTQQGLSFERLVSPDYPRSQCLPELFEAQVERTPNAVALVYGKEEVSYRELDNQANRVSRHLRSLSIVPEAPVGICGHRSREMVAGLVGILKAGGACLPLGPVASKQRLLATLKDSGARALLTQESLQRRFKSQLSNCKVVCLDSLPDATAADEPEPAPHPRHYPDNLAYIIYTSGSTGTPKGVELTHRGLVNLLTWQQRAYRVSGLSSKTSAPLLKPK